MMSTSRFRFPPIVNDAKFVELLLYVAKKSEFDETFGMTKLNKILFFADFIAYQRWGQAITWATYQKLPNGPAPRILIPTVKKLVEKESVVETERQYFNRTQKRIVALRPPDLKLFTGEEVALVDEVLDAVKNANATQVSDLSHQFVGWELADMNGDIPYQTALIDTALKCDDDDVDFAASLAGEAADFLSGRVQ